MQSKTRWIFCLMIMTCFLVPITAGAEALKLPRIFTDNMVLQRDLNVEVWGWADAGDEVSVSFARQEKTTKADKSGKWRVELAPLKASAKGRSLTVTAGDEKIAFKNVLVGEVWLCSGQSNMEFSVKQSDNAKDEIASANHPLIRHIQIEKIMLPEPIEDVQSKDGWEVCSPETVGDFTAAGYFFGKELLVALDVPIGLLHSSWGGSPIAAFIPLEGYKAIPELADTVTRIESSLPKNQVYKKTVVQTMDDVKKWLDSAEVALEKDERVGAVPALPATIQPLNARSDPANKYNAMLHGLIPFRIRGAIWYQGESDHNDGMLYLQKTRAQLAGWRKAWGQPDLPYYFIQIAPYQYGEEAPERLAEFWEVQAEIEKVIPNTGMAVIHDVGNLQNIHPTNKQAVGHRLAILALARTYGKDLVDGGPQFDKMQIEKEKVRVFFTRIGSGLETKDGKAPDWFEIAGQMGEFVPANAVIDGETVVLSAESVKTPCAMRYGWSKLAEPNLRNKEGYPVAPFRSGKIAERALADSLVEQAADYQLIYSHEVGGAGSTESTAAYREDNSANVKKFDRVAYFLALQKEDKALEYVWISMDPFTKDAKKIGIPTSSSGARFQQQVENMEVISNVQGVTTGKGLSGNIEFWPNNYAAVNEAGVSGASDEKYDFGDTPAAPVEGYGSMQIHNTAAKQTIMALNKWNSGPEADVGIGNHPTGNPDYTFASNANVYKIKRLMVFVHPAE